MNKFYVLLILVIPLFAFNKAKTSKYDKLMTEMATELSDDLSAMGIKRIAITNLFDDKNQINQMTFMMEEDLLVAILDQRKGLEVMERNSLQEVLNEQKLNFSGIFNEETMMEIGELESVDAVVTGNVLFINGDFFINIKAMSTKSGMVISARKYVLKGKSNLKKMFETPKENISFTNESLTNGDLEITNYGRRKEIVFFYNNAQTEEQRSFSRRIILKRGESVVLENIPTGNLQYNAFKHKNSESFFSMVNNSLFGRKAISMSSVDIQAGVKKKVKI